MNDTGSHDRRAAAIHVDRTSGHVRRRIGDEKTRHIRELFSFTNAAHGNFGRFWRDEIIEGFVGRLILVTPFVLAGSNQTDQKRVDEDIVGGTLSGKDFGECHACRARHRGGSAARAGRFGAAGQNIDDPSPFPLGHARHRQTAQPDRSKKLEVKIGLPAFIRAIQKRTDGMGPGIVHQNIDASEIIENGRPCAFNLAKIRDITGQSLHAHAVSPNRGAHAVAGGFEFFGGARNHRHIGPGFSKLSRHRKPKAFAGPRDHRRTSVQSNVHIFPPRFFDFLIIRHAWCFDSASATSHSRHRERANMTRTSHRHTSHWGTFTADVTDGRLTEIHPFKLDPDPSPIIQSLPDAVYDESRVARPMFRKGWLERAKGGSPANRGIDPFVAVPWDEALDLAGTEIERVRSTYGNAAIFGGSYGWSSAGRFHHAKSQLQRFLNTVGGFTDQVHTYSIAAGYAILPHVLGTAGAAMNQATSWDSIIANTELMVAFGGVPLKNAHVAAGGPGQHMTGPYLKEAHAAGVAFVNISPIRDDVADHLNAEWLAIRPNTDVAMMLALAYTLETENLADQDFLARYCVGYAKFRSYLLGVSDGTPKTADWAATICEIPADQICALARRMAAVRTMINTNWSLQRGDHGEQTFWMTVTLAAMLGGIGRPGEGFGFGYGSMGNIGNPRHTAPSPSLSIGKNPCDSWIPVARIADMLLHPGESYAFNGETRTYPDIKLVYWCGGNPFHHHQDLNRLVRAWRKPDTIIVNEPWWTATAKFSDIVLPSTTTLERKDIGATSRDRFILAMDKVIEPVGEARDDFEIFRGLARRLGTHDSFTEGREPAEWLGSPIATSRPLHMISNQPRTRLHGQLDNGRVSRDDKINGREPVWINPLDAAIRELIDGDIVRVFNDRGALLAGVRVTHDVRPGVIQLATGAWYDPVNAAEENSLDKHGNPNVLTIDKGTSQLGQGPIAHSALVEIERYDAELPEVTAHKPPPIVPRDEQAETAI